MLLRLRLNRPKANIIDAKMISALDQAFTEASERSELKGILLDHEGPHFSFGASVEEHLPSQCGDMLRGFHGLIRRMVECPIPILVQIRGQCLGGGLEVACAGNLIFAAPDAVLGQPEIKLAVFAPAASCILPERIGHARAEDLLFSGRSVTGEQAAAMGLVTAVADQPEEAALAYFDGHLAPLSGSSLRYAGLAARKGFAARVRARLTEVEELYL
jgi:cyclohexa-1,5-dienecarbonyl-CoA hydratase